MAASSRPFERGEAALFLRADDAQEARTKTVVNLDGKTRKISGLGVVDLSRFEGMGEGEEVEVASGRFLLLRPNVLDHVETLRRKAQIVLPKDAAYLILHAGIGPGARVVEAGLGSAALTIPLAHAVGSEGRVTVYEKREDFLAWGRENVEAAGLAERVAFRLGDVTEGTQEREQDAVLLDIPDPWAAVPGARQALRPSGTIACYSPLVSQMERTVRTLQEAGFLDIRSVELVERSWVVGERGSRPAHDMLGHTGFLTFARKGRRD